MRPSAPHATPAAASIAPPDDPARAAAIQGALRRSGGNVVAAARLLGIGRNALRYRMRRLGIDKPSLDDLTDLAASLATAPATRAAAEPPPLATGAAAGATPRAIDAEAWERKRVAALAIDLAFSDAPGDAPPYEPWTAAERWRRAIRERLRGFGAVLLDETATRITAAFGVPRALEQTPQRAVQAALALQHLAATGEPRPELRIAVHAGEVQLDPGPPALRVLALGDTLTLPERLLGHAGAGEILVSARLARQVPQSCRLERRLLRLGPRPEDEVAAFAVAPARAAAPADTASGDGASPFVGRQRELEMLDEACRSAAQGHGQVVFVAGEAGIGKSRLLAELRQRLDEGSVLWIEGRCTSYGATTPLLPIVDGLRRFVGIDDRDGEPSAGTKIEAAVRGLGDDLAWTIPFVRSVLSLAGAPVSDHSGAQPREVAGLDSASRRSETFRALRALLLRAAEQRLVVLIVEDLHWIDRTSEEFLAFVADAIPALRAVLVCTHRPGYAQPFGDRSYFLRLTLRPLSEGDMAAITRSLLGTADMPPELRALVARKAEGNPFFVEEVTRSLLEDGSLRCDGGRAELTRELADISIPDTIQDVLTARIDRLADEARRAIQVASVIGREFALRLLERITQAGDELRGQLDELRAVELIYEKALHPELAYMFKHALTHDVAYRSVGAERRRALHRTIGLAIEELYAERLEELYETLAHHFSRAEEWERALDYHDRAAEKAERQHATQAVVEHCRHALAIADRLGESASPATRRRLEARTGLACFYLSEFAESARAFERAARASLDPAESSFFAALAAQSHLWAHDYDASRAAADAAVASSPPEGAALAAEGARPAAAGRGMARNVRGFMRAVLDADLEGAEAECATALELVAARAPDVEASIRLNQTLFAEWTGDYPRAIELAERVMAEGKRLRLAHLVVWPYWFLGKARCCLGDYGAAIALLEEGYQFCDRIGDRAWKSRLLNTLGWCLAEIGCVELASEHDRRAAALARELGDPEIVANSEINLAVDHLGLGRIDEAHGFLEPIESALSRSSDPWMRWRYSLHVLDARARIELRRAAPERALELALREHAGAVEHRAPKLEARALVTAGAALLEAERRDEAREHLASALAIAERLRAPRFAWRSHALLARLAERRGAAEEAERHARAHADLVAAAARTLRDPAMRGRLLASEGVAGA
jgi:tetratricopeptide (TPR) repeat protein